MGDRRRRRHGQTMSAVSPFSQAHKRYVQLLYRRALKSSLDWYIRRDLWRDRAIEIRVAFERNRHVRDPRAVAQLLREAEKTVEALSHPNPYRAPFSPDGTKWERNLAPPMFTEEQKRESIAHTDV